jgi:hypothetical protein
LLGHIVRQPNTPGAPCRSNHGEIITDAGAAVKEKPDRMSPPPGVACQVEAGRLWDVLILLRLAIGWSDGGPEVRFGVHVRNDNRHRTPPLVQLKALCGPGDHGWPVVTVMMQDED